MATDTIWSTAGPIFAIAVPTILCGLFGNVLPLLAQILIGHAETGSQAQNLAANGLASMLFNASYYFLNGATTALDTYASQAQGAGDTIGVGLWTRRAMLCLFLLLLPWMAIMFFASPVLQTVFRVSQPLADLAQQYTRPLIPGLGAYAYFSMFQKVLSLDDVVVPPVLASAGASVLLLVLSHFLRSLGGVGVAYALTISRCSMAFVTFVVWWKRDHLRRTNAVKGEASSALLGRRSRSEIDAALEWTSLSAFFQLAVSGGLMWALEGWIFDLVSPEAEWSDGAIGLAAYQSLLTLSNLEYLAGPFGVGIAATLQVGKLLGAGNVEGARRAHGFCKMLIMSWTILAIIFYCAFRWQIGGLFSHNEDVRKAIAHMAPFAGLLELPNCYQTAVAGTLRAMGRQSFLLKSMLGSMWLVGVPCGYMLVFSEQTKWLGTCGLWLGVTIGMTVQSLVSGRALALVDWEKEAQLAQSFTSD